MSARDLTLQPLPVFRAFRFLHSCRQILLGALADVQIARPGPRRPPRPSVKLASRPPLNSTDCGEFVAPIRRGQNRHGFRFWMKPPRTPFQGAPMGLHQYFAGRPAK